MKNGKYKIGDIVRIKDEVREEFNPFYKALEYVTIKKLCDNSFYIKEDDGKELYYEEDIDNCVNLNDEEVIEKYKREFKCIWEK